MCNTKQINGLHFNGSVTPSTAEGQFKNAHVTGTFVVLDKVDVMIGTIANRDTAYTPHYLVLHKESGQTILIRCTELVNTVCTSLYKKETNERPYDVV